MIGQPLRLHVLSLPWTMTTDDYSWCAYTQKARRFSTMMQRRGHDVILYAGEDNQAECSEHVVAITRDEQGDLLGTRDAPWDPQHQLWQAFNTRAARQVLDRALPGDFLCLVTSAQSAVADKVQRLDAVEFGVGYAGVRTAYRVWESYAWMHTVMGARHGTDWDVDTDGRWYDAVIPNFWDPDEFHVADPGDYFLFIGRGIRRKGPHIAATVAEHLGSRLVLAGDDLGGLPDYGERIGPVGPAERSRLMAGAVATFVPTTYVGPFEGVAAESLMSGTPVICTDHGAMTEYVHHGDGWRCRTIAEFVDAAVAAQQLVQRNHSAVSSADTLLDLDRRPRRARAVERFGFDAVGPRYERFFQRLSELWGPGWGSAVHHAPVRRG